MAEKIVVTVTDDFDGSSGAVPVRFGLDGKEYVIDLSPERARKLRKIVTGYAAHGRRRTAGTGRHRPAAHRRHTAEIRRWAKERGHNLSERGRIPDHIVAEYEAHAA